MSWPILLAGGLWGAAIGSYLACAACRIPRRIDLSGRSFCPSCGEPVPGYLNIPVLSWIWLRGRSACCQERISPRYLLWEAGTALCGAALVFLLPPWILLAGSLLLVFSLAGIARFRSGQGESRS